MSVHKLYVHTHGNVLRGVFDNDSLESLLSEELNNRGCLQIVCKALDIVMKRWHTCLSTHRSPNHNIIRDTYDTRKHVFFIRDRIALHFHSVWQLFRFCVCFAFLTHCQNVMLSFGTYSLTFPNLDVMYPHSTADDVKWVYVYMSVKVNEPAVTAPNYAMRRYTLVFTIVWMMRWRQTTLMLLHLTMSTVWVWAYRNWVSNSVNKHIWYDHNHTCRISHTPHIIRYSVIARTTTFSL